MLARNLVFLAAFYFISQSSFLMAPGSARTNLAIFFFGLSIMLLFLDNISDMKRKGLFLVFVLATIVSHYSTTYIFFFLLLSTFILSLTVKKYCLSRSVTWASVAFMAVVGFLWYSQVVQAPFNSAILFLEQTFVKFQNLFVIEARSTDVGYLFGYGIQGEFGLIRVQSLILWLSFLLIAFGIIATLINPKICYLSLIVHRPSLPLFLQNLKQSIYC